MVFGVDDAVHNRVAEVHVVGGHVYLGAEYLLAVGKLSGFHAAEEVEILLRAAVAPRAFGARNGHRAASRANLLLGLVVHIGLALFDELFGPEIELVEIVGGVVFACPPESEPLNVLLYRVYVFDVLLDGVRVVEAQVAFAAVFLREAEIEADALGMSDVEITVGFGREAGLYAALSACYGLIDYLFKEVHLLLAVGLFCGNVCHIVFGL